MFVLGTRGALNSRCSILGLGLANSNSRRQTRKKFAPPSHQFILRGLSGSIACTAPMYLEAVSIEETGSRGGRRRVLFETHCLKLRFAICRLETGEAEQVKGPRWP